MKIDSKSPYIAPYTESLKKGAPASDAQKPKTEDEAFQVHLSEASKEAAAPAENEEELRRAKIAAIREQLASGTYNISGKDVANKILNVIKG